MTGDRDPLDRRQALQRLAAHPALPEVLGTLEPRVLTRLYDAVGLNDAGALMAATPAALVARALDDAAWRDTARGPRFAADVFVDWLEVWLDAGTGVAVERLWALDEQLLTLAFAELLAVDDSLVAGFGFGGEDDDDGASADPAWSGDAGMTIDRFLVRARQPDDWDIARAALLALWEDDADRLVALLDRLSVAGGAARRRLSLDAAADREDRREQSGFVSAEAARGFLATARALTAEALAGMREYDAESARHLARVAAERGAPGAAPVQPAGSADAASAGSTDHAAAGTRHAAVRAELDALLRRAELIEPLPAVARVSGPPSAAATLLERSLQDLAHDAPARLDSAAAELAYLANVLRATPAAATDAAARTLAAAVTNLGMELLQARGQDVEPGHEPGLIQPFLLGWRVLLELPARLAGAVEEGLAAPLIEQRLAARPWLTADIESAADDLRRAVRADDHDAGREALALLSLVFDPAACRAARQLLGTPPAFPVSLEDPADTSGRPLRTRDELSRVYLLLQMFSRGGVAGASAERGVQHHHQREAGQQ